jgi:hypothetical protein
LLFDIVLALNVDFLKPTPTLKTHTLKWSYKPFQQRTKRRRNYPKGWQAADMVI